MNKNEPVGIDIRIVMQMAATIASGIEASSKIINHCPQATAQKSVQIAMSIINETSKIKVQNK